MAILNSITDTGNKHTDNKVFSKQSSLRDLVLNDLGVRQFLGCHPELSKDDIEAGFPTLYEYYQARNNKDSVTKDYVPELFVESKNKKHISITYHKSADAIKNDKEKARKKRLELINLPDKLRSVDLKYVDYDEDNKPIILAIADFVKEYRTNPHARGLYLCGDFGVGKTYLMAGMANLLAEEGHKVVFLHMPTFISSLNGHIKNNSVREEIQRIEDADILIIDDIGAETLSAWSRDNVLSVILQARMDNALPTFFTSNFAMEDLQRHFAEVRTSSDPVKAARLMQRIKVLTKEVVIGGKNRRLG